MVRKKSHLKSLFMMTPRQCYELTQREKKNLVKSEEHFELISRALERILFDFADIINIFMAKSKT